jgi:FkbM family methyltransferase
VNTVGRYSHPGDFNYIKKGLAGTVGKRTLYLSNVPTGSSILELDSESSFVAKDSPYFFPMRTVEIDTYTLESVLNELKVERLDAIKLDVQGVELEIMKGIDPDRMSELNSIEMEVGLHPVYKNQTTLPEVQTFMKEQGFGLYDMRTNRSYLSNPQNGATYLKSHFNLDQPSPSISARLYELDTIYLREPEWILRHNLAKERILRIIALYCLYNFFSEGILISDQAVKSGKLTQEEGRVVNAAIVSLNSVEQRSTAHYNDLLSKTGYLNWGQYMWVPYPSY